jgi:hypothetical protein
MEERMGYGVILDYSSWCHDIPLNPIILPLNQPFNFNRMKLHSYTTSPSGSIPPSFRPLPLWSYSNSDDLKGVPNSTHFMARCCCVKSRKALLKHPQSQSRLR